jgi:type II secretory pathway predicted ATPase ExeA/septal ring-binding cell division protein DamX
MYYAHFGLTQPPFKITPNTEFFFPGGNRGAILDALLYAISQGEGIIKVSGEVGSGKTMLCRMLETCLPEQIESVYLANPSVSPDEILHAIAFELQLAIGANEPRIKVMQELHNYLLERHMQKRQVVVFVEESQSMPLATLEEIRLLSNLETGSHKLLQIVLFGQPELDEILRQQQIRQLRERITYSFSLKPLNTQEIKEYLMFRMRAAGYRGPDLFSPGVVHMITKASEGLTRRVNLLADKALLAAFADNTHTIKPKHVKEAIQDSEFSHDIGQRRRPFPGLAWLLFGIVVGALLYGAYFSLWPILETPSDNQPVVSDTPVLQSPPAKRVESEESKPDTAEPPRAESSAAEPHVAQSPAATPSTVESSTAASSSFQASEQVSEQKTGTSELGLPLRMSPAVTLDPTSAKAKPEKPAQPKTEYTTFEQYPILQQRIEAAQAAFALASADDFSIQLFLTDEVRPPRIERFLTRAAKLMNLEEIYVYPVKIGGQPRFRVFYGLYPTQQEARQAISQLPTRYAETFHLRLFKVGEFQN